MNQKKLYQCELCKEKIVEFDDKFTLLKHIAKTHYEVFYFKGSNYEYYKP